MKLPLSRLSCLVLHSCSFTSPLLNEMSSDGGTIEQLAKVQSNLNNRLNEGIARVLESLRVAEEKEVLAENALSLLQHVLDDTLHIPKFKSSSTDMNIVASFPHRVEANESFNAEIEKMQTLSETGFEKKSDDFGDILQSTALNQYVDETQQYILVTITGIVGKYPWTKTRRKQKPMSIRLDITMQTKTPIAWEIAYAQLDQPGHQVQLIARAPWQCILASAATQENNLWADLRVVTGDLKHNQYLGSFTILSPAALLQRSVLQTKSSSSKILPLLAVEETILASGNRKIAVFEQATGSVEMDATTTGYLTRIIIKASSMISLASYISALRLTVADTVQLRILGTSSRITKALENWLKALQNETDVFRQTAATKCVKGLDEATFSELLNTQISLDEACGLGKEVYRI